MKFKVQQLNIKLYKFLLQNISNILSENKIQYAVLIVPNIYNCDRYMLW